MMPCAFTQTAKSLIQDSKSKEAYEFTIKQPPLATIRLNSKVSQQSLVSSSDSMNWVHNLTFQEMPQIHMRRTDCYGLPVAYLRFRDGCEEINTGRKRILTKAATRTLKETLRCVPRFLCAALIRRISRSFLLFAQNATRKQSGLSGSGSFSCRRMDIPNGLKRFKHSGCAHATADAHGHHAVFQLMTA